MMDQRTLLSESSWTPKQLHEPRRTPGRAVIVSALLLINSFLLLFRVGSLDSLASPPALLRQQSAGQPRSGWFDDSGLLDFDDETGWKTRWSTPIIDDTQGSADFYCDDKEILPDGHQVCVSGMKLLRKLYDHLHLQNTLPPILPIQERNWKLAESAKEITFLRGRRILILGDSIDRNFLTDWREMFPSYTFMHRMDISDAIPGLQRRHEFFGAASFVIPIANSVNEIQDSSALNNTFELAYSRAQPEHHFRVDFAFLVGSMVDRSFDFEPTDSDERIRRLFNKVGVSDRSHTIIRDTVYDTVSLNYGLWDLASIQRQLLQKERADPAPGLSTTDFARHSANLERQAVRVRKMFPSALFSMRLLHDIFSSWHAWPANADDMVGIPLEPTFKPMRVVQIRNAQTAIAKRHNLHVNPFALRIQGYGTNFTFDGVHPHVRANMLYAEIKLRELADYVGTPT